MEKTGGVISTTLQVIHHKYSLLRVKRILMINITKKKIRKSVFEALGENLQVKHNLFPIRGTNAAAGFFIYYLLFSKIFFFVIIKAYTRETVVCEKI